MLRTQFARLTALGIVAGLGQGCGEPKSSDESATEVVLQPLTCPATYEYPIHGAV